MRDAMPISLWLKWRAWFKFQGPPGGLGADLRSASIALECAKPHIAEDDRVLARFLRATGRRTSDYAAWLDFGDQGDIPDDQPAEYSVE